MAVTELDVTTGTSTPSASLLASQANQYGMLFKCFIERSYKSGRGKIINVTKEGLNDKYTFVTAGATSLWDSNDQCKPAFFAAADVGINYNALDSLISYAGTLQQSKYTAASWAYLTSVLTSSESARDQDYSVTTSADTALGEAVDSLNAAIEALVTGVNSDKANNSKIFALNQNYPNPFNPTTNIDFSLPKNGYITLKVYNILGQEVAALIQGFQKAGTYKLNFDASHLASGVYIYRLQWENVSISKKLVLVK